MRRGGPAGTDAALVDAALVDAAGIDVAGIDAAGIDAAGEDSPRPSERVSGSGWAEWADAEALAIRSAERWREPRDFDAAGNAGTLTADGRRVVAFASNDYLGLSRHPTVVAAAHAALDRWGCRLGRGATRRRLPPRAR
ncbi:MAG: hypothetical protein M5T61_12650 [Acidimicrobiia bacterium]|nr:hypothetical protein [Acidimicrobiia bacterium]